MIAQFKQPAGRQRRTTARNLFLAALIVGALHTASGQAIYTTKFEAPALQAGFPLSGQDGWTPATQLAPFFSSNAAIITKGKPTQGKQTVRVEGADLVHSDVINELTNFYYDAIGSYRRPVNYNTGGTQTVRVSAHVRIDGPQTVATHNFFSAGIAGRAQSTLDGEPSSASVGELVISSDGHAYAYSGNALVPTFLASVPVKLGAWHDLAVVANFATHTSAFYVDGVLLTTFAWEPAEVYSGVLLRGALLAYVAPDTAANKKADYASTYDKFSINITGK